MISGVSVEMICVEMSRVEMGKENGNEKFMGWLRRRKRNGYIEKASSCGASVECAQCV